MVFGEWLHAGNGKANKISHSEHTQNTVEPSCASIGFTWVPLNVLGSN